MTNALVQLLIGICIAGVSSWLTVRLSRNQFKTQRWWEKRVEAYERVIDAFHGASRFASEHLDAEYKGREVAKEREAELEKQARRARDEIARASDMGSFILSKAALGVLARYEAEVEQTRTSESWYEYLDSTWSITHKYMKEFIAVAQRDLET